MSKSTSDTGAKIRKIRLRKGLTMDDVAKACEVTHSYIALIEDGTVSPTLEFFERVLSVLSTTPAEFYAEPIAEQVVFDSAFVPKELTVNVIPSIVEVQPHTETDTYSGNEVYFYVLSGRVKLICDGNTYLAVSGSSIYVKPYMMYKFVGFGGATAKLLSVMVHSRNYMYKE